jgi:hypothetical protein
LPAVALAEAGDAATAGSGKVAKPQRNQGADLEEEAGLRWVYRSWEGLSCVEKGQRCARKSRLTPSCLNNCFKKTLDNILSNMYLSSPMGGSLPLLIGAMGQEYPERPIRKMGLLFLIVE